MFDEFDEMTGHRVTIMCHQHPVLFGAQTQHFRVINAGVQIESGAR